MSSCVLWEVGCAGLKGSCPMHQYNISSHALCRKLIAQWRGSTGCTQGQAFAGVSSISNHKLFSKQALFVKGDF